MMLKSSTTIFSLTLSKNIAAVRFFWIASTFFLSILLLSKLSNSIEPKLEIYPVGQTSNHTDPGAAAATTYPKWFEPILSQPFRGSTKQPNIGLVNMDGELLEGLESLQANVTYVEFDKVSPSVQWEGVYPLWIDEDGKERKPICPDIPMPDVDRYRGLDVVVAKVSCGNWLREQRKGIRDVYRLQISLVVAKLAALSSTSKGVSVVFVSDGRCEPMWEIFRCDDLISRQGRYWVYKPDVLRLKQKLSVPVGSCEVAAEPQNFDSKRELEESKTSLHSRPIIQPVRETYVTVLHSGGSYLCGAIALAQSILRTNTTKDLVLLADKSLSPRSIKALTAAGWKVKRIERIRCPSAKKGHYNEWNCSKLRIWLLTEYTKVIFIDADFIVLKNIDHLFAYPQLSAAEDTMSIFNSGVMIIEPSKCLFDTLVTKSYTLHSYNGGDQGLLNEAFTWWHRVTKKITFIKFFMGVTGPRNLPNDFDMIHFVGVKPWLCYRDYDCNWDQADRHDFASDAVHSKWWEIYDILPDNLRPFCGITKGTDNSFKKWRVIAKNDSTFPDDHWKIEVKDPRQFNLKDFL